MKSAVCAKGQRACLSAQRQLLTMFAAQDYACCLKGQDVQAGCAASVVASACERWQVWSLGVKDWPDRVGGGSARWQHAHQSRRYSDPPPSFVHHQHSTTALLKHHLRLPKYFWTKRSGTGTLFLLSGRRSGVAVTNAEMEPRARAGKNVGKMNFTHNERTYLRSFQMLSRC